MSDPDSKTYDRLLLIHSVVSLFQAVLQERRKHGKYPLQKLAEDAGIDKSKISRDFAGDPNWRLNTVSDIASALGIDIEVRARNRATGMILSPSGPVPAVPTLTTIKTSTSEAIAPLKVVLSDDHIKVA